MKKGYLVLISLLLLAMIIIPLTATSDNAYMLTDKPTQSITTKNAIKANNAVSNVESQNSMSFKVKRHKSSKIETIDLAEYLIGVTAAEIGPTAETEALKAQAICAHTLALFRKKENAKANYDITDDSSIDQNYIDIDMRKEKYGDNFEKYEKALQSAISQVLNKTITYNNEPILAVYCDTSGGKTESAKNMWGKDYPYLQPVESISDMMSDKYISTVTYTSDEFKSMASSLKTTLSGDAKNWIGAPKCSNSGTVLKQKIGSKEFSGSEIRTAFNLRSANFDIDYKDQKFIFTVRGYGHGVGMSQNGANYMAKNKSSYEEILLWYYTGCKISG